MELLKRINPFVAALDVAVAALSATLIKQRLIPENVEVVGTIGSLVVLIAVLVALVEGHRLRRRVPALAAVAALALAGLLAIQVFSVETVAPYGPDEGAHSFLVGRALTPTGQQWWEAVGATSRPDFIARIGDGQIAQAWGTSYRLTALLYALTYTLFLGTATLAITALAVQEPPPQDPERAREAAAHPGAEG